MNAEMRKLLLWHDRRQTRILKFRMHPTDLADTLTDTPIAKIPVSLQAAYRAFKKCSRAARLALAEKYSAG